MQIKRAHHFEHNSQRHPFKRKTVD